MHKKHMESNTYTQVKEWFKKRDFSFDYYIEFEKQEYMGNKIKCTITRKQKKP